MLDVRKLLLLRELARRDTIAAVAEALCYTPSAVSQQLAALERDAGVPLLQRTGRRVSLTPAGAALAGQTEEILALLERAAGGRARRRAHRPGRAAADRRVPHGDAHDPAGRAGRARPRPPRPGADGDRAGPGRGARRAALRGARRRAGSRVRVRARAA